MAKLSTPPHPHVVLFPFMSKGHTIPLLQLAKLIHKHRPHATFTIFTTPANEPFISSSLSSSLSPNIFSVIALPFVAPDDIPPGVESTDQLPSMSLFPSFATAMEQLQPHFETALENLQQHHNPISFLISDGFLYWTQPSASKFNIPRLTFYGMNIYAPTISRIVFENIRLFDGLESDDQFQVPDFPWIKLTKNDFGTPFCDSEPKGLHFDFVVKCGIATSLSYGLVVNSFEELEPRFLEYSNSKCQPPKSCCVGPFCLVEKSTFERLEEPVWINWLNKKRDEGKHVLYIAFGSQAEISNEQLKEIITGIERSEVDFIWALRIKPTQEEVMEGFEKRVIERGLVVRGWIEQREILGHESVQGFLSHCGWNSVIESMCAGVPILAWPMMAEQHLNARMVVEEIKVGLRVETCDGSVRGFVKWEGLSKMVQELMRGEMGKAVKKNVKDLGEVAKKAVEEGGSSWRNLESLLNELETADSIDHKNVTISNERAMTLKTSIVTSSN